MSYQADVQGYGMEKAEDSLQSENMRKMFVGGLNRDTTSELFESYFSQFGEVEDTVIITDTQTKVSRGFGFVTYKNSDSVQEVFKERPHNLDGKEVEVKRAMPREFNTPGAHAKQTRLFVGGFKGFDLEPDELRSYLELRHPVDFGTIDSIDFLKDKESGTNKGFGFIDCSDCDFADRLAISETSFTLKGRKMSIKKAEPKEKDGGGGGRGGRGGTQRGGERGGFRGRGRGRGGNGGGNYSSGGYGSGGNNYQSGGGSYNQSGGGGYNQSGGYNNQSFGGGYGNNQGSYQQQGYGGYNQGTYGSNYQQQSGGGDYSQSSWNQAGTGGAQRGGRGRGQGGNQQQNRYTPY